MTDPASIPEHVVEALNRADNDNRHLDVNDWARIVAASVLDALMDNQKLLLDSADGRNCMYVRPADVVAVVLNRGVNA